MRENEGLRITALYSVGCPELRLLNAENWILKSVADPAAFAHLLGVAHPVLRQIDPFVFYQLIAAAHGRTDFFSEDIVRAHWLSSDLLLKTITREGIQQLLQKGYIPTTIHRAEEIILRTISLIGALPHHNFVVLSLLKRTNKDIQLPPDILGAINSCLVMPGEVVDVQDELYVRGRRLKRENGRLTLEVGQCPIKVSKQFVPRVGIGEYVSYHLSLAREKLSPEQVAGLETITDQALFFCQKGQ